MTDNIKFIHTADLHLGRPLSSGKKPPERLRNIFNNAGYKVWENICELAIDQEVEFVLVSGDLYDREARSVRASRNFIEQCKRLENAGINVYAIYGNHDPLGRKKELFPLPQNVYFFSSEKVENLSHKTANSTEGPPEDEAKLVEIMGQSYRSKFESRKMYTYYTSQERSLFKLGLLHTQLDPDNKRYVPVSRQDLRAKENIDYWALGHIHQPEVLRTNLPVILYPGIPQARNIKETGIKGCFLVELTAGKSQKRIKINFAPLCEVVFAQVKVDISRNKILKNSNENLRQGDEESLQNLTDLKNLLANKAEQFLQRDLNSRINFSGSEKVDIITPPKGCEKPKGFVVRWLVTGHNSIHELIAQDRDNVEKELARQLNRTFAASGQEPFLWTHSLRFRTSPELPDREEIKNNELYGEIKSVLEEIKGDENLKKSLINEWGEIWQGSSEPEDRRNDRFYPDEETIEEILQAAHEQIITHLFSADK